MITSKKGRVAKYYVGGMTPQRYDELMNSGGSLTEQEMENGWGWWMNLDNWEDRLVHSSWPEAQN